MKIYTTNNTSNTMWTGVVGYEDSYLVSDSGLIRSVRRKGTKGGFLKQADFLGYKRINLNKGGKYKTFSVHRLVALAFIPNPKGLKEINHKNGVKNNNSVNNLEWVSRSENTVHSYALGLHPGQKNELNGNSRLKTADIIKIRELYKTGLLQKEIAKMYGVVQVTISNIITGKRWSSV